MELWAHQKEALKKARGKQGYALFFDVGTGKTATVIYILKERYNERRKILRTLIFTPPSVVTQFREEWFKFSKIDPSCVVALQGSGLKRIKEFKDKAWAKDGSSQGRVFITNYEALLMKELFSLFKKWQPECVVFDESHKLKNPSASRSKLAYDLTNIPERPFVALLTGTPVLNTPLDLFQQVKVMLGGFPSYGYKPLVTNFFHFRAKYFRDRNAHMPKTNYFPKWEPMTMARDGFDAVGEIKQIVSEIGMRVEKNECLDLPPQVDQVIKVGMTKDQARVYQELKDKLVTYINDASCVASLAIVKALRLMQITSGFVSVGEEDERAQVFFEAHPKLQALQDLLEVITPTSKVLIWAVWKENYKHIRALLEKMNIKYVEVHGEVSGGKREENIAAFYSDSGVRVLVGHPGSAGIGLTLIGKPGTDDRCAYSIFYSRTFSLEHYLQARARNYRGGQTDKVTHYDLVCHNTIDEQVITKLANKEEIGDSILELVKEPRLL